MTTPAYGEGAAVGTYERRPVSKPAVAAASAGLAAGGLTAVAQSNRLVRMAGSDEVRRRRLQATTDEYRKRVSRQTATLDSIKGRGNTIMDRANRYGAFAEGKGAQRLIMPSGVEMHADDPAHVAAVRAEQAKLHQAAWDNGAKWSAENDKLADMAYRHKEYKQRLRNHIETRPADRRLANAASRGGKASAIVGATGLGVLGYQAVRNRMVQKSDTRYAEAAGLLGAGAAAGYGAHRYAANNMKRAEGASYIRSTDAQRRVADLGAKRTASRVAFNTHRDAHAASLAEYDKLQDKWNRTLARNAASNGSRESYFMIPEPSDPHGRRIRVTPGSKRPGAAVSQKMYEDVLAGHGAAASRARERMAEEAQTHRTVAREYGRASAEAKAAGNGAEKATRRLTAMSRYGRVAAVVGGVGALGAIAAGEAARKRQPRFSAGSSQGRRQSVSDSKAAGDRYRNGGTSTAALVAPPLPKSGADVRLAHAAQWAAPTERAQKMAATKLANRDKVNAARKQAEHDHLPSWYVVGHQTEEEKKQAGKRIYGA